MTDDDFPAVRYLSDYTGDIQPPPAVCSVEAVKAYHRAVAREMCPDGELLVIGRYVVGREDTG